MTSPAAQEAAEALKIDADRYRQVAKRYRGTDAASALLGLLHIINRAAEALAAPEAEAAQVTERTEEVAWVIEHGASLVSRPRYYTGICIGNLIGPWSEEHLDAIRFCREEDARRVAEAIDDGVPNNYRIAEHIWLGKVIKP